MGLACLIIMSHPVKLLTSVVKKMKETEMSVVDSTHLESLLTEAIQLCRLQDWPQCKISQFNQCPPPQPLLPVVPMEIG